MNKIYFLFSFLILSALINTSFAQTPTISPEFFTASDELTITYDVTGTNLASLSEAYIWMWLPDKSINAPSNINPANSNPEATAQAKFTKSTSDGRTFFSINMVLADFYNQNASQISEIGMLLKGNDWSDGQTGDFITSVSDGFDVRLESPEGNFAFYDSGDQIPVRLIVSEASDVQFLVDGVLEESATSIQEFITTHNVIDDGNTHQLTFVANNGDETKEINYSYSTTPVVEEQPTPEGAFAGINYNSETSVTLVLVAPNKENVFVIGDFNDWSLDVDYLMFKDGNQFWLTINNLIPGQEYQFQYLVDGTIRIHDPYTEKISSEFDDPEIIDDNRYPDLKPYPVGQTSEAAGYIQTNKPQFDWSDGDFVKPEKEDLVIYELLVRDFTDLRTFDAVTKKLDYLESLGINAIEFMPVMEFEGNLSWGYNPFAMLSLDKYYGTEYDLKTLVNEAHNRGIAIILDIALNHQFGRNALVRLYNEGTYGNPTSQNPWFNTSAKHDFNVGYDMNHESQLTQDYVDRIVAYWIEEYHVDGYRYDLSKGFTQRNTLGNVGLWGQYDASRVALLKRLADVQWAVDPGSYVILEHFAENNEERELANYGMMLWGNENHNFRNLAKGNNANISGLSYLAKGWNDPHVIGYMESHDEERVAWDLANSSSESLARQMQRLKLNAAFFFLVPGPKMIWQFGEFGYDEELNNDRLGIKPTKWGYLDNPERNKLFQVYQSLIKLKIQTEILEKQNFGWNASSEVKWIRYNNQETEVVLFGNFSKESGELDQQIVSEGTWYDYFTGKEYTIESSEDFSFPLAAGEFRLLTSQPIENYISEEGIVLNNTGKIESRAKVYPNPAQNNIYINLDYDDMSVQLLDMNGKVVPAPVINKQSKYEVNVSQLPAGMYFMKLSIGQKIEVHKIIKQ
ncbi:hypothetical protein GCM10011506_33220 [Marivirga lumbricoides]|uniref:Glycosyl hydrolase family 13 catalytic domain-containing protein n=1 Tax=Marivirga lumbricoides TaxID=1046115 RepID=A0ABQ1MQK0_9BACT|nr:hypothetical protein GCM10011506_33220 [Marivirga lumbricoides]